MKNNQTIDLRSDTVTKPTKEMLDAMFSAEVGDDVFEEDPTVNALEIKSAELFGKEAGLFVPSGTMANQISIRLLTSLQDEIICDKLSHIYYYEAGGTFSNSGVSVRLIEGNRGRISAEQIHENINDPDSSYLPSSTMVSLENTCNKGGGSYYKLEDIRDISGVCKKHNLKIHLDGARIFNALAETKEKPSEYGNLTETLSFCFSKGLGAPSGSMLLSTKENIKKARKIRKAFGGGMRQIGYIAAAGIYALDHHIPKLLKDHYHARLIGDQLMKCDWVEAVLPVDTNIIVFRLIKQMNVNKFLSILEENKIRAVPFGPQTVRMVTHLDISAEMTEKVIQVLKSIRSK